MNAIVMAGGFGKRLAPLTDRLPKPMLSVANRPMLDYCVAQLYHYGINDIVFSLGYRAESIIAHALGYKKIKPHFFVEDTPLGTLGGVRAARDKLADTFLVVSGDGISNIDLSSLMFCHKQLGAEVTVAVKKVDNPALYGIAELDRGGFIKGFVEKPHGITAPSFVNCGTYVVSQSALDYIVSENCDFARDLFPRLVAKGKLAYCEHKGYWRDIGDIASYYHANFEMAKPFYPFVPSFERGGKSCIHKKNGSLIAASATIPRSVFDGGLSNCVIGKGCRVDDGSKLQNCIVTKNSTVNGNFSNCIIDDSEIVSVDTAVFKTAQVGLWTGV